MRKKILTFSLLLAFIIVNTFSNVTYAVTHTLDQLADTFNNCKTVKQYKEYNYNLSATSEGNKLTIEGNGQDMQISDEYTLNGSVLSVITDYNGLITAIILADCVGQINDYEDGALFETMNSEEVQNYTVEKEGFEVKQLSNENFEIKIDIDKKIPIVDSSKIYLNTSDFDLLEQTDNITGVKSKMSFRIVINNEDGKDYIHIGELNTITESTYKSILSAIEVIFKDSKAVEYFKSNYSGMTEGSKQFAGFDVDVDVQNDEEIPEREGTKVTLVTVDRNETNKAIEALAETDTKSDNITENTEEKNDSVSINEAVDTNKKTDTLTSNNQRTGDNITLYIIMASLSAIIIVALSVITRRKK